VPEAIDLILVVANIAVFLVLGRELVHALRSPAAAARADQCVPGAASERTVPIGTPLEQQGS
jgi:hypothetical protein